MPTLAFRWLGDYTAKWLMVPKDAHYIKGPFSQLLPGKAHSGSACPPYLTCGKVQIQESQSPPQVSMTTNSSLSGQQSL